MHRYSIYIRLRIRLSKKKARARMKEIPEFLSMRRESSYIAQGLMNLESDPDKWRG
jgi:hypothetical protein